MKKTLISSKNATTILGVYFFVMMTAMAATWHNFNLMASVGLLCMVVMVFHLARNAEVQSLKMIGNLKDHFFVIDEGPFGRSAEKMLPEGLRDCAIFVPGNQVREKANEIRKEIQKSENSLFDPVPGKVGLKVHEIWFARGQFVDERWNHKKYKKRVLETVAGEIIDFHSTADGDPEKGFSAEDYEKIYIK